MADNLFIGLMSGTSLDGVDAALVKIGEDGQVTLVQQHFIAYPAKLRTSILSLQHPTHNELETSALIANKLASLYALVVEQLLRKAHTEKNEISAIGAHGQTIRHRPELGFTLQICNAALLAELTGIRVISDFRSRDIAAGGQGAPLVPAFHQAVFSSQTQNRAIVNIGGIANITYLGKSGTVFGFDSGPGNMLLDAWVSKHLALDYDEDGAWARTGQIIEPLLAAMLKDGYFSKSIPKSTGRDLFNLSWLSQHLLKSHYAPSDVARTLVALTAYSIHDAIHHYCADTDEIYLCGGGEKNSLLKHDLQQCFKHIPIKSTEILGIGVDWVEAIAFAWLAKKCLAGETANLTTVTGAAGSRILGAIYQV
ncbi:MAG: anhydro-N-acetylmuramic acid kinase [Betaproteobacteria bacterium HGW-Betaproteobacteria-22]|nr:MAG: anhydro-N-acetylmuramic acid kinase [Betaproteobacteria bacterium HGW-Betaproteobacteria-22]